MFTPLPQNYCTSFSVSDSSSAYEKRFNIDAKCTSVGFLDYQETLAHSSLSIMSMNQQCADALESMRKAVPLCHCITNYVSMDVMANTLLAIGASPIMVCAALHRHP